MRTVGPEFWAVWAGFWVFGWAFFVLVALYLRNKATQRRLEMIHQERMAAMEKGIPLPELPELERPWSARPRRPTSPLQGGIVCISLGTGAMITLYISSNRDWVSPLPLVFLGAGQLLYYYLTKDRAT